MKAIKNPFALLVVGLILGVLGLAALRFFNIKSHDVHYHANFAVYVNGVKDQFKNPLFYEEVQSCDANQMNNPKARAHIHDGINDVVHVEDSAVTWDAFFNNLGYAVGSKFVQTGSLLYVNGDSGKVTFILNGQEVDDIANRVINDKDVLLVSYGNEDSKTLMQRYSAIPHTAEKYDTTADPATCSGSEKLDTKTKLKKAFGFGD